MDRLQVKKGELLPCPFCGGDVIVEDRIEMEGSSAIIHCTSCDVRMERWDEFNAYHALEEMKQYWNRRV